MQPPPPLLPLLLLLPPPLLPLLQLLYRWLQVLLLRLLPGLAGSCRNA
jgi:hypothetical protein